MYTACLNCSTFIVGAQPCGDCTSLLMPACSKQSICECPCSLAHVQDGAVE